LAQFASSPIPAFLLSQFPISATPGRGNEESIGKPALKNSVLHPRDALVDFTCRFHLVLSFRIGQGSWVSKKPMRIGRTIKVLPAKL
jgi:hypothetical protein